MAARILVNDGVSPVEGDEGRIMREAARSADQTTRRDERIPRGTLPLWVHARIRECIITGEYPVGMRLNEVRLAESLQVSRVALRESFNLLERDGFIEQRPRRSAVVTGWDATRVNDLFDARIPLEVEAVSLAVRRLESPEQLLPLEDAVRREHEALDSGDLLEVAEVSTEFHQRVVDLADNALLSQFSRQIAPQMVWLFFLTSARSPEQACAEHEQIIDVLRSGNDAFVRSVMHAHIEGGREPTLRVMQFTSSSDRDASASNERP